MGTITKKKEKKEQFIKFYQECKLFLDIKMLHNTVAFLLLNPNKSTVKQEAIHKKQHCKVDD